MAEERLAQSQDASPSSRILPLLLPLFVGSGCAALIYEVGWLQLLQLVIGSTAFSLGVLLATFMGGMCLGSLILPVDWTWIGPNAQWISDTYDHIVKGL